MARRSRRWQPERRARQLQLLEGHVRDVAAASRDALAAARETEAHMGDIAQSVLGMAFVLNRVLKEGDGN
jgi:hypothetical protein